MTHEPDPKTLYAEFGPCGCRTDAQADTDTDPQPELVPVPRSQ